MDDERLLALMGEIHKELARIASSLEVLEKVARSEHPNLFRPPIDRARTSGDRS